MVLLRSADLAGQSPEGPEVMWFGTLCQPLISLFGLVSGRSVMQKGPVAVTSPKHSLEVRLDLLENLVAVFIGCEITFVEE